MRNKGNKKIKEIKKNKAYCTVAQTRTCPQTRPRASFLSHAHKYDPSKTNVPIQKLGAEVSADGSHDLASDVL